MRNRTWMCLFSAALSVDAAFAQLPAAVAPPAAVAAAAAVAAPATVDGHAPSTAEIVSALKNGGLVVYFRHAATDFSQNDEKMRDFDDCANQRNLTDAGREQSRKIGAAWRALGIPVGNVYASPYCRTRETAQLAFGKYERAGEVRGGPGTASDASRYRPLSQMLSAAPAKGVNDIIVSHGNPFRALHPEMPYLAEGEAAIIKPLGEGRHEVFGRVTSESWPK
jgi:phosphohistidine phosphatase SixA